MNPRRTNQRLTQAQKNADNKQWYKDNVDMLDMMSYRNSFAFGTVDERKRKSVNYDLMNNIIRVSDFEYVCQPYGAAAGELPAKMTNRDIVSGKINSLLGWEMKRPFTWKVVAVNPEATSRKEQEEKRMLSDYVVNQIVAPIRYELEMKKAQELQGKELTPQQQEEVRRQIEQELAAQTPPEVRRYMQREHQDIAEIMGQQILNYLYEKEELQRKFNLGWKHALLSSEEVYYIGEENGNPVCYTINSKFFDCDRTSETPYIHHRQWAGVEYWLTPEEIITRWGDELDDRDIDDLYEMYNVGGSSIHDADFTFDDRYDESYGKIRVIHKAWRGLQKVGFLTYIDADGVEQEKIVSEDYRLNVAAGDVEIQWEWIPQVHEGIRIGKDKYVRLRPVPFQYKDLNNLKYAPLPFVGAVYSDVNSIPVSVMDRMKSYQYYYNIIMYRIEVLMASDLGKFVIGNIKKIPRSMGIDTQKFMYYAAANRVTWANPDEEGSRGDGSDISQMFKEIDLSMVNQLKQYIELAEYIETKCGESVGIPKQVEAQISPTEAVTNVQQQLIQSSNLLEPLFDMHNNVKKHVLTQLLEKAKVIYTLNPPASLVYTLDDLSIGALSFGSNLAMLDNSTFGVFVTNSTKANEAQDLIKNLAHAAMQTQSIDLSDVIRVVRSTNIAEAEEQLREAEQRKADQMKELEQMKNEARQKELAEMAAQKERDYKHELDVITLKEKERRETELKKQAMLSTGFNPDKDVDRDGMPDVMEIYRFGMEADIEQKKLALDSRKLDIEEKKVDKMGKTTK